MKVTNTKVLKAIEKLESKTSEVYQLRTDCVRNDLYKSEKFFLYKVVDKDGYHMPGAYGSLVNGFKTQKEFIDYVYSL